MEIESELRATSDALLADLDRLRALELEKRRLPADSPRLAEIAVEIESLAVRVLHTTDHQANLARESDEATAAGRRRPGSTIESVAPVRDVHTVLADWREAERALSNATPGSKDEVLLRAEIRALREEYRRAHDAAARRTDDRD